MKATFRLIVALLLIAGWGLSAASLHVVRTEGAPIIIPKDQLSVTDTYVDVRAWTLDDVSKHPAVSKRLIATGKSDALKHVAEGEDVIPQINDAIEQGPKKAEPASRSARRNSREAKASFWR